MDNKLSDDMISSNLKYQMRQQRGLTHIAFYFLVFSCLVLFYLSFVIILFLVFYFLFQSVLNLDVINIIFCFLLLCFVFYIKDYLLASWKVLKMMSYSLVTIFSSDQQLIEKISNSNDRAKGYIEKKYVKDNLYFISYKFWDKEQRLFEKTFISHIPISFDVGDTLMIVYHHTFFYTFSLPVISPISE